MKQQFKASENPTEIEKAFQKKFEAGYVFRNRYLVDGGKLKCKASGDTPEEAIEDARRLWRIINLAPPSQELKVTRIA